MRPSIVTRAGGHQAFRAKRRRGRVVFLDMVDAAAASTPISIAINVFISIPVAISVVIAITIAITIATLAVATV